ncbi:MAG TPA: GNAT family protein [Acidimicrobiales bacterium]|nr:GNAT family protein [Acidimicrobiales bacterium]
MRLTTPTLAGRRVRLEPLTLDHAHGLALAARDRLGFEWTRVPDGFDDALAYVGGLLEEAGRGAVCPYAQVSADGEVLGATRYLAPRWAEDGGLFAVEVGGTWLSRAARGTGVNVEAKLLLLTHAFDRWGVERVDFKTDARNHRSRGALASIGATFEGVLRSWQPSVAPGETGPRDSAMFSVVRAEWPAVRDRLAVRLAPPP